MECNRPVCSMSLLSKRHPSLCVPCQGKEGVQHRLSPHPEFVQGHYASLLTCPWPNVVVASGAQVETCAMSGLSDGARCHCAVCIQGGRFSCQVARWARLPVVGVIHVQTYILTVLARKYIWDALELVKAASIYNISEAGFFRISLG